ncbi:MAG: UDP-N-acetylglucosamine--N-acetylmuramyl-(pentapeptide) pyrophosphoryl-undecaprenol N-acetylglucosamine transferase, partial [Gemmatimonadaceae bacterium]
MIVWFAGGGTGGHLYPGLAIARALVRADASVRPLFIGARRGLERDVLPTTEFAHLLLDLHPLYRARPWENWRTALGFTGAWRTLGRQLRTARPALVLGTGGYASGAALAYAVSHGVPIALQEQNSVPGLTTRWFSRYAREIYLGYGNAAVRLRANTGTWVGETGNPIEPPPVPRPSRPDARLRWSFPASGGTVVLVIGGSQGARAVNDAVAEWVRSGLPDHVMLIWGTGRGSHERYASLGSARVRVVPYLAPIADAYAASDLAVSRAGALTLAELCAWNIPAILIPLPTAAADHQSANARVLGGVGAAILLEERSLVPGELGERVQ